jgi:hypothetical protein
LLLLQLGQPPAAAAELPQILPRDYSLLHALLLLLLGVGLAAPCLPPPRLLLLLGLAAPHLLPQHLLLLLLLLQARVLPGGMPL